MAKDITDSVTWFLSLPVEHRDFLGRLRHWINLKIGTDGDTVWVKDFTMSQIDSVEVHSIPYKNLFYSHGPKLFPAGSILPARNIPSLLWTPVDRGLPVELPAFNHNYFGVHTKAEIRIVRSSEEHPGVAMIALASTVRDYVEQAPRMRLERMTWTLIDGRVMMMGVPLLPIEGEVYWNRNNSLLPVGYDFEFHALAATISEMLARGNTHWIVWDRNGTYRLMDKKMIMPLSVSSFRQTVQ